MMKKTVVLLFGMICMLQVFAQEEKMNANTAAKEGGVRLSKWTIEFGGGAYTPLNSVYANQVTDYLQPFREDVYPYFQVGTTYFFHKNWGAVVNVQMLYSGSQDERGVKFINSVYNKYNATYFMETSSAIPDGSNQEITTGGIGIVYRHQYKKWSFMPKLIVGITGSYGKWGKTLLKQKGTNNYATVNYTPDQTSYNTFALIPAFTASYRLSRKFMLNIDLTYNYTNSETVIDETETDLNTNAVTVTRHEYKKPMHAISAGAGLSYIFK